MKGISPGIVDFKKAIETSYYVDKSQFIEHVIQPEVCLFTRPRRFGKTLNMSMLKYFFDINEKDNAYLFDGLKIIKNKEIMKHQNKYPVISISLKRMEGASFEKAIDKYANILSLFLKGRRETFNYDILIPDDQELLNKYMTRKASVDELEDSLLNLSYIFNQLFNSQVIILIDEYDVPLRSAYRNGYYDEMVDFLRSLLGGALKDNDYLFKGVLTGCLRIARESIFTGLNNFSVFSIFDEITAEDFGFTQSEVDEMLRYYHLEDRKDDVKAWYDGYRFGDSDIYNPWSVLQFLYKAIQIPKAEPISYWVNSSGNDIIYDYIRDGNMKLRNEFDTLVQGKSITKTIVPELTYREMDDIDNIYSFLLFTGYLKPVRQVGDDTYELMIPNKEVRRIYEKQFKKWLTGYKKVQNLAFVEALKSGDVPKAWTALRRVLRYSVSYFDEGEKFYHGLVLGMVQNSDREVTSNREFGDGRYDICLLPGDESDDHTAIIIECKVAHSYEELKQKAQQGLQQIEEKHYDEPFVDAGYTPVYRYGIAFYKKECQILMK